MAARWRRRRGQAMIARPRSMFSTDIDQLLRLLDLEPIDRDLFRGSSPDGRRNRIFGGQVLAQALIAAGRTVEARSAHSLHGYFLRPGDPHTPILYEVDRIREGRSFATRRVRAIQNGEAIANLSISYHAPEDGLEHQTDADVPDEVDGELYEEAIRRELAFFGMEREADDRAYDLPIEVRTREGISFSDASIKPPKLHSWMRTKGALPDDPALHQAALAYASDLTVMLAALHPHPVNVTTPGFRTASLDHAMWFHRPFRFDEWLFFEQEAPVVACGRGFGRGTFRTRQGQLVASCAQEGLMRYRPPAKDATES
jgi:acyl-CoA thioesterase-2